MSDRRNNEAKNIATDLEEFADERMSEWERVFVRDILSLIDEAEDSLLLEGVSEKQLEKLEDLQERYL